MDINTLCALIESFPFPYERYDASGTTAGVNEDKTKAKLIEYLREQWAVDAERNPRLDSLREELPSPSINYPCSVCGQLGLHLCKTPPAPTLNADYLRAELRSIVDSLAEPPAKSTFHHCVEGHCNCLCHRRMNTPLTTKPDPLISDPPDARENLTHVLSVDADGNPITVEILDNPPFPDVRADLRYFLKQISADTPENKALHDQYLKGDWSSCKFDFSDMRLGKRKPLPTGFFEQPPVANISTPPSLDTPTNPFGHTPPLK